MAQIPTREDFLKISKYLYQIDKQFNSAMRVPAQFFVDESMFDDMLTDRACWQLINVATLPGIKHAAIAMPDIHQGYGFPIGGVAATAIHEGGVISPGGIGYDINCGVRLLTTNIQAQDAKKFLPLFVQKLWQAVPSGVGYGSSFVLSEKELDAVLTGGAQEMLNLGFGTPGDIAFCEDLGMLSLADSTLISYQAKQRGKDQLGTLGSGNHFLEIQRVAELFDQETAKIFGLHVDQLVIMIHCGSRGFGHQVCTDYVKVMMQEQAKYDYQLPDRELACVPFLSQPGQRYFAAMAAAANYAWANRHMITHQVRTVCQEVFGKKTAVNLMYDVSHNMGKKETHNIDGKQTEVIVHRKGATRAFGPNHPEITPKYRDVGQPVLIPGTMGTSSYVLAGTKQAMEISFGTSCHGAGRKMSRIKAREKIRGGTLKKQLEALGILVCSDSNAGLAQEAPFAYKDVDNVVDIVHGAHIAKKIAKLKPLAVVKGG